MKYYKMSIQNFLTVRGSTHQNGSLLSKTDSKAHLKKEFSICTWNAFKGLGGEAFKLDLHKLIETHDIVCLQEVILCSDSRWHNVDIPSDFIFCANYLRRDGLTEGIMTVSSFLSEKALGIPSIFREPLSWTSKLAMISYFPIAETNESLMLINIHSTLVRTRKRFERELLNILEKMPEHDGPVIFCGDFNTLSPAYLKTCAEILALKNLKLHQPTEDTRSILRKLDHFFVRNIATDNVKVLHHIQSSDHFPISATFRYT